MNRRHHATPVSEDADGGSGESRGRLDRWLWCARFFKSRALACQAVSGGRVHLNGSRVKPAHVVRAGDRIGISLPLRSIEVLVRGVPERRGPAAEAQRCYEETQESVARAVLESARRRVAGSGSPRPEGRPDKRDRRRLAALARGQLER
jgi:ribosome-associated heat shock protein Hsp15